MLKFSLRFPRFGVPKVTTDLPAFFRFLYRYIRIRGYRWFAKFESIKDVIVDLLYKRRGKYTRPFLHFGTIALVFAVITFGPYVLEEARREDAERTASTDVVNLAYAYGSDLTTNQSEEVQKFRGGEIQSHIVSEGETLSSIAQRYGLQVSTIVWESNLDEKAKLKPGQELRILPVDGVRHKVARGETIYTIAKKYGLDESEAQGMVDYPFNSYKNDETFELAVGQIVMVPDGVKPQEQAPARVRTIARTLDAGAVTASGAFVWPAAGRITQGFRSYHPGYDIANRGGGPIVAADSGTIVFVGWDPSGYGNKVIIDHGNGYQTLYAHLSAFSVQNGQRVRRGDVIGSMGSTGRSTGVHLHFEIRRGGVRENPGNFLK